MPLTWELTKIRQRFGEGKKYYACKIFEKISLPPSPHQKSNGPSLKLQKQKRHTSLSYYLREETRLSLECEQWLYLYYSKHCLQCSLCYVYLSKA